MRRSPPLERYSCPPSAPQELGYNLAVQMHEDPEFNQTHSEPPERCCGPPPPGRSLAAAPAQPPSHSTGMRPAGRPLWIAHAELHLAVMPPREDVVTPESLGEELIRKLQSSAMVRAGLALPRTARMHPPRASTPLCLFGHAHTRMDAVFTSRGGHPC